MSPKLNLLLDFDYEENSD